MALPPTFPTSSSLRLGPASINTELARCTGASRRPSTSISPASCFLREFFDVGVDSRPGDRRQAPNLLYGVFRRPVEIDGVSALSAVETFASPPFPSSRTRCLQARLGVRSRMSACSNSASAPKTWKISRPLLESVSIASFRFLRPTPWLRISSARVMRSLSDLRRRSRHHTTRVSPVGRCESACCGFGRSPAPPAVSSKMRLHPASFSAARCRSSV